MYPLIIFVISTILGRRPLIIDSPSRWPSVAIIVTGHNIENLIPAKLKNIGSIDYPGELQVLFVFDGSTDAGEQLVSAQRSAGYRYALGAFSVAQRRGKEFAIREALTSIESEVLVFSDGDAFLDRKAVKKLVMRLMEPGVGAVSGREIHQKDSSTGASEGQGLFYKYEEFIKRHLDGISSLCYVQGGNFAMWKYLYPDIIPAGATQDGIIAFELVSKGFRVAYAEDAVSRESYELSTREDYARRVRTVSRAFYAVLSRWRIVFSWRQGGFGLHLISSRVLRWFTAPIALLGLVTGLVFGPAWYQVLLVIGAAVWGALCLYAWRCEHVGERNTLSYFVFYFSYIHVAAAWAVGRVLLGERMTIWQPTKQ